MNADLALPHTPGLREPVLPSAIEIVSGLGFGHVIRRMSGAAIDAFIDTGASRSCVPQSFCRDADGVMRLEAVDRIRPLDWQGNRAPVEVPVFLVWINFLGIGPLKVWPCETRHECFLVGRDLLAHFLTILDGPAKKIGVRTTGRVDRFLRRWLRVP